VYLLKEFRERGNYDISKDPDIPDPITNDKAFYERIFQVIKESAERVIGELILKQ